MKSLIEELRRDFDAQGWTHERMAGRIGMSGMGIYQLLRSDGSRTSAIAITKLARALGWEPTKLGTRLFECLEEADAINPA